ncbi:hypothetical protein D3C84_692910 [compost metagenome]
MEHCASFTLKVYVPGVDVTNGKAVTALKVPLLLRSYSKEYVPAPVPCEAVNAIVAVLVVQFKSCVRVASINNSCLNTYVAFATQPLPSLIKNS